VLLLTFFCCRLDDAAFWMLDAAFWMLLSGCCFLDAAFWMLLSGCCFLDDAFLMLLLLASPPHSVYNKSLYTLLYPFQLLKNTDERSEVVFLLFSGKRP